MATKRLICIILLMVAFYDNYQTPTRAGLSAWRYGRKWAVLPWGCTPWTNGMGACWEQDYCVIPFGATDLCMDSGHPRGGSVDCPTKWMCLWASAPQALELWVKIFPMLLFAFVFTGNEVEIYLPLLGGSTVTMEVEACVSAKISKHC